jgi:hypothetical protein
MCNDGPTGSDSAEPFVAGEEIRLEPAALVPPKPGAVLFLEARHAQCRWPLWQGDGEPRFVCGAPPHPGRSYCREHWLQSGGSIKRHSPTYRQPKAAVREQLSLAVLRRNEGF